MRLSHATRGFVWIVALVMFGVRLSGVHLHLCLDGQEPSASLHLEHDDGHDEYHHLQASHQDQDVDLLTDVFVKKAELGDIDVLAGSARLLALLPLADRLGPELLTTLLPTGPPHYILPPLRGPPV
jgi:hypothetical protein